MSSWQQTSHDEGITGKRHNTGRALYVIFPTLLSHVFFSVHVFFTNSRHQPTGMTPIPCTAGKLLISLTKELKIYVSKKNTSNQPIKRHDSYLGGSVVSSAQLISALAPVPNVPAPRSASFRNCSGNVAKSRYLAGVNEEKTSGKLKA